MSQYLDSDDEYIESDYEDELPVEEKRAELAGEAADDDQDEHDQDDEQEREQDREQSSDQENEQEVVTDPSWTSKDGTQWFKVPPPARSSGRTPKQNIIRGRVGITPYATSRIENETSAFKLSLNDHTIKEILLHTNEKGREKLGDAWEELDFVELDAFFGLMILAAVFKANKEALEGLWAEEMGRPIFRATMSLKRFRTVHAMLRYDDKRLRSPKKGSGILNVWLPWVENQGLLFRPKECITVDEQLYGYRGRVFCKVYMDKKPAKYGFRIDHANCSCTGYVLKSQLYLGKDGERRATSVSETTVCNLVLNQGYEGRNVTTDNYYTSASLATTLQNHSMTLVGTLRKNKRCIPPALLDLKGRQVGSSLYAYTNNATLLSYLTKKDKHVLVYSSMHRGLQEDTGEKPAMIEYYNATKGAVDTVDRRIASYSVKRATRNWMTVIFCDMMDISLNNAFILFGEVFPGKYVTKNSGKRQFMVELGSQLVDKQIVRRKVLPRGQLAAAVVCNRKRKANETTDELDISEGPTSSGRKRCYLCKGNDNKHRTKCANCLNSICTAHTVTLCVVCNDG